jgi:hypothetical protein
LVNHPLIDHGDHRPCAAGPEIPTIGRDKRSGMTTTELRAKIRAVPTGGLFFRLLTR